MKGREQILKNAKAFLTVLAIVSMFLASGGSLIFGGTTGIISGIITDSETGERLAGVNVIVEGTRLTTVTNENGYYVITNVPPGEYVVIASLVGYADVEIYRTSVFMDVTSSIDIEMTPSIATEEEVVIIEYRPMIRRDVIPTSYVIDSSQEQMVKGQAHLLYQTPGIVATHPGVISDPEGYPHIRGGRKNQIGYMLDGIPITDTVTNGFATNIVTVGMNKMEMFTGGYRPEYGNAISGVFNQVTNSGRNAPGLSLELLGGTSSFAGIRPEIGGYTDSGMDYYVGAYLWQSNFKEMMYDEVQSRDLISKINYPIGDKNTLTFLFAEGAAQYYMPSMNSMTYGPEGFTPTDERKDKTHQEHALTSLTYSHVIDSSSFVTLRPYYFQSKWNIDALSDEIGYWWDAASIARGLQLDYTNQLSEKHLLKFGGSRISSQNRYWANVPFFSSFGLGDYEYMANTDTVQTGLYIQNQMALTTKFNAEVGLRYDHMTYKKEINPDNSESQISPRFGFAYAIDPETKVRFSYGRMIQFVYTQAIERNYLDPEAFWPEIYYGTGTGNLKPERCVQYDFGIEREINNRMHLQVTPFYRKYTDLLQTRLLDPDNPDFSPMVYDNLGEGTSKGVELLLKLRPTEKLSGWLSYTYSEAKAQTNTDREVPVPGVMHYVDWDQRHTASLVLNYAGNNGWNYAMVGQFGSGLPYNLEGEPMNSRRVAPHTLVNLNISKEIEGGWLPEGEMHLSIANLFNSGAVLARTETGTPAAKVMPRFVNMSYVRRF